MEKLINEKLTEDQVLQELSISDFHHLSKENVLPFASLLPNMDPDVAKKALAQFPDFPSASLSVMQEYSGFLEKAMQDNSSETKACHDMYNRVMDSLQKMLEKDDLPFDEQKYILEQMKEIADKVSVKDTENKNFLLDAMKVAGKVALGIAVVAGGVILGKELDTDWLL